MDNEITLQDGDVFTADYNGKARIAKVVKMMKGDESACCALLDEESLEPTGDYRTFTIAKLEGLQLIEF